MTNLPEPDRRAVRVLELRRAGLGFGTIADQLNLDGAAEARQLYDAAFEADDLRFSNELEAARLDRLHTAIWPAAARGEVEAIDRVLRISERRQKLIGEQRTNTHELRDAFNASLATSNQVQPVDGALVEAGRKIADRVDDAIANCEGQELTKALYLMPHLVNVLREALATPASRVAAGVNSKDPSVGKLAQLRELNKRSA